MFMTAHGVRQLHKEEGDLRTWLSYLSGKWAQSRQRRTERKVRAGRLKRIEEVLGRAEEVPSYWGHKPDARAGDTIYLRCKDTVRAMHLVAAWRADPMNGDISVVSPLGHALLGKRLGARVMLDTLDGPQKYEIIKIV
jgi:transcription elongation GreA/GreB family factor